MAGDWIKMRVWIARDPRVISMADFLSCQRGFMDWLTDPVRCSCKESAYEHVARHVTVSVTVTGLLQFWGVANDMGKPDGDDLLLSHCDLSTCDMIAGFPCFGDALAFVGWAIEDEESECVKLPKFLSNNVPRDERKKAQDAERQRKHRAEKQRDKSVTPPCDKQRDKSVTVTPRREEIREDKNNTPLNIKASPKCFVPPTLSEVYDYCQERKNSVDPQRWIDHYSAKGWMIGKNKMKDWRAAVRTWEKPKHSEQERNYSL